MWSGLDLSKLGQALEKVRKEVDQAVDTALGIDEAKKLQQEGAEEKSFQNTSRPESSAAKESQEAAVGSTSLQEVARSGESFGNDASQSIPPNGNETLEAQLLIQNSRHQTDHSLERLLQSQAASQAKADTIETVITLDPEGEKCSVALRVWENESPGISREPEIEGNNQIENVSKDLHESKQGYLPPIDAGVGNLEDGDIATELTSLRVTLAAREQQLQRQAEQMAELKIVHAQLQEKNEQLVMRAAEVSEDDLEAVRKECDLRVQAVERKVYALTKERDALRRGSEKLTSASELLKEKDEIIKQVMDEGQVLSKKQLELETALKKRKTQVKDLETAHEKLTGQLTDALASVEQLTLEKSELVKNLQSNEDIQKDRLKQERLQFEALLKDAKAAQVEAEQAANLAAKEGLTKQLRDANEQIQALSESNTDLSIALSKLRSESEEKERALKEEVASLERKYEAAEARHEELAAKFPEATQPLVRQLEVLQADANARAEAWSIAEMSMMEQLESAESQASIAQERERMATRRLQSLQEHCSTLESSIGDLRAQLADSVERCNGYEEELASAIGKHAEIEGKLAEKEAASSELQHKNDEILKGLQEKLSAERSRRQDADKQIQTIQSNYEKRLKEAANGTHRQDFSKAESRNEAYENGSNGGDFAGLPATLMEGSDVERLKALLRSRQREFDRMSKQLQSLESTRDRLSGELVAESQRSSKAQVALMELKDVQSQLKSLQGRYNACVELLGEREEKLAELEADLQDVKELYRDQISFMAEELTRAQSECGDL